MSILNTDIRQFNEVISHLSEKQKIRILVVTDRLNYDFMEEFGLTEFVKTLRESEIYGIKPTVTTAQFTPGDPLYNQNQDPNIENFKFNDPQYGLKRENYDVLFIFSFNRDNKEFYRLENEVGAKKAIIDFMQAGGGVFATGDHDDLGAGMCVDIPRVNKMRYWKKGEAPNISNETRLTTMLPAKDGVYEFDNQADELPQRLYVNYRTEAGGIGKAHPLVKIPRSRRVLGVFPDHPHEGECRLLSEKEWDAKIKDYDQEQHDEWPVGTDEERPLPEAVAYSMSYGNNFIRVMELEGKIQEIVKQAVVPRAFIAICAYDGQRVNVGRVVTDSTWHHFINLNLVGFKYKDPTSEFQGLNERDLNDIKQYYKNLATWLIPKDVRQNLTPLLIVKETRSHKLFEELLSVELEEELNISNLGDIGASVVEALATHQSESNIREMFSDLFEKGMGEHTAFQLSKLEQDFGNVSAYNAGLIALGKMTVLTVNAFNGNQGLKQGENFENKLASQVKRELPEVLLKYLEESQEKLDKMKTVLGNVTNVLKP